MGFTVQDVEDLAKLIETHEEWRQRLRALLLGREIEDLPDQMQTMQKAVGALFSEMARAFNSQAQALSSLIGAIQTLVSSVNTLIVVQKRQAEEFAGWRAEEDRRFAKLEEAVARLAEAQARTEERVSRLEERVSRLEEAIARLTEAQARTEEQLSRLEEAVARLAEAQARTEERVSRLEERVSRLEEAMARLAEAQARTEERISRLEEAIARLTEAQARAEEQLSRLIEAQARTEERVSRLEEAYAQVEERLSRLERTVAELAERLIQLEQTVAELTKRLIQLEEQVRQVVEVIRHLAWEQRDLRDQLNRFGSIVGLSAEGRMAVYMERWLQARGYRLLMPIASLPVDSEAEIDGVTRIQDASGNTEWVLVSVRVKVRRRDFETFAGVLQRQKIRDLLKTYGITGKARPFIFGIAMEWGVEEEARRHGIGLVMDERGEIVSAEVWEL
jgi:DNA repair exonuclease SbcCD ATPase subunit